VLEIRLLGDPLLAIDGAGVPFRAPEKALSLLGYVALHPGEILRARLAVALWPDVEEDAARSNVRRHLHLLLAALPNGVAWVRGDRRTIAWAGGEHAWIDTIAFDALSASDATLGASADLYRGDLLAGLDDEWIVPLRERYRERHCENLAVLMRRCRARGESEAATEYGTRLRKIDPWREDVVRELMEIRFTLGDRAGALRLYQDLEARLRDELGVEPAPETVQLFAWMRDHGDPAAEPAGALRRRTPALPATSFHGRERDVERVRSLLRAQRFVTLTGPGGVGKTRLAVETAAQLEAEFEDGVQLADMAAVNDPALVAERIAQSLGVRQPPGSSAADTLIAELRDRDLLLIVDNCEHVLTETAQLTQRLVRASPRLRILVTSREALRIADEHVHRVEPLAARAGARAEGDDLLQSPAVQLFIDRAIARDHTLDVTPHLARIAEICERLDGLPLAIELAAANLSGMSIRTLADRIGERLDVSAGPSRVPNRGEASLRAVFDWSYDRLSDGLQRVFVELAVFRGGFTVAAAHAVAGGGAEEWMSLQLVAALAEQSLLAMDDAPAEPRYRMLETTRAFAGERLASSGTAERAQREHAAFFARSAERARISYETLSDGDWLGPLDADRDNFTAALERTLGGAGDARAGATIAAGLADYWLTAGQESTAIRWLAAATHADPACAHARVGLGAVYRRGYRFDDAVAAAQSSLDSLRTSRDSVTLCRALVVAGNSLASSAAPSDAATVARGRAMVLEALEIARAHHHVMRVAEARFALGIIAHYLEDLATALQEFEAAQDIFTSLGKRARWENASLSIALIAYDLGDLDRAAAIADDLTRDGRAFHRVQMAQAYEILGTIAMDRGDLERARSQTELALRLAVDTGLDPIVDARLARIARIDAASGHDAPAARLFGYAKSCEDAGTLRRPPRERVVEQATIERLAKRLGDRYTVLWGEGYRSTRAEAVATVLSRRS
jgi:predicted ATPase/DNA-binding SARP family transcriptional activator